MAGLWRLAFIIIRWTLLIYLLPAAEGFIDMDQDFLCQPYYMYKRDEKKGLQMTVPRSLPGHACRAGRGRVLLLPSSEADTGRVSGERHSSSSKLTHALRSPFEATATGGSSGGSFSISALGSEGERRVLQHENQYWSGCAAQIKVANIAFRTGSNPLRQLQVIVGNLERPWIYHKPKEFDV